MIISSGLISLYYFVFPKKLYARNPFITNLYAAIAYDTLKTLINLYINHISPMLHEYIDPKLYNFEGLILYAKGTTSGGVPFYVYVDFSRCAGCMLCVRNLSSVGAPISFRPSRCPIGALKMSFERLV